jgi:hypothetical protein
MVQSSVVMISEEKLNPVKSVLNEMLDETRISEAQMDEMERQEECWQDLIIKEVT